MTLQKYPDFGYVRVASAVPRVNVADVDYNVSEIVACISQASTMGAQVVVLPELCVTSYTCADLFASSVLLDAAERGIARIAAATQGTGVLSLVGAPVRVLGELYNCAVALQNGKVLAVIPKTYIPNYQEFYEKRWFTSYVEGRCPSMAQIAGAEVPFGTDVLLRSGAVGIAAEVCEDLWTATPPSSRAALCGAQIVANLSASNELIGKHNRLLQLITSQSSRCIAAYVYASAGYGESSTDLVFAGNAIIAENGSVSRQSQRFSLDPQIAVADIDVEALDNERRVTTSFADARCHHSAAMRVVPFDLAHAGCGVDYSHQAPQRKNNRMPFVPQSVSHLSERCQEIISIQTQGLMRRMQHTGIVKAVIGISGGLDSTLALLVTCRAFDRLGLDRSGITGITMPGFGTTDRTYGNALTLMRVLGVQVKEIPIAAAVKQHFADIGQDINVHDVTYENGQARERTQILMDYANKIGALVIGTGDLSELALGWATYNGDHMSMYNVNVSIPKTLAQHLVRWFATEAGEGVERDTLIDVLDTPISPELTPADDQGQIKQKTEDIVGPYALHDFFLYHTLRNGFGPAKIFMLARHAFDGEHDAATIKKWLTKFYWRFFSQQFKRSCLPDGPKVGTVSLSPRGDWRMPSDAAVKLWIAECESL